MLEVHSTKKFIHLPCGHAQFFDRKEDGSAGHCAAVHGYDRSVEITFSGQIDENGWIVPFGGLKKVKRLIEFYQDHVTCLPANDPRLNSIIIGGHASNEGVLGTLRVLPYGVSMEMTSVFLWELLSPAITHMTNGRCYISKLQVFEHERNTGFVTVDRDIAMAKYAMVKESGNIDALELNDSVLKAIHDFVSPKEALDKINLK